MVIVQITGGLGNQLFMYAAGRRLSLHHGTPLKLDIAPFRTYAARNYLLDRFHIAQAIATPAEIDSVKAGIDPQRAFGAIRALFARRPAADARHLFRAGDELAGTYLPEILRTPRNVYLQGYWQSEQYFQPIEQTIRDDLRQKAELAGANLAMAGQIGGVDAVSLHVRRGDYAGNPHLGGLLGVLPLDYYHRAVERVGAMVKAPHFFVFSDDPDWAKAHLRIAHPATFVAHNGPDAPQEDLRLMALCRHHVTANSSLSWWGAWLCPHAAKTVIAPARWFLKTSMPDIAPAAWIRL
jgi:hypothetical protein